MKRIFSFLKFFRRDLLMLLLALKDPATPGRVRVLLVLAICYLLSPVDLIPDTIPFFGVVDDLAIVPAAVWGLRRLLPLEVARRADEQADWVLRHGTMAAVCAGAFVLFWCLLLVFGLYTLLR